MKPIFEGWRRFVNEAEVVPLKRSGFKEFSFSPEEFEQLNNSIASIVKGAKIALGAEGPVPQLKASDFAQSQEPKRKMVAEVEEPEDATEEEKEEAEKLQLTVQQYRALSPEQLSLRQRYYGPEGEIKKRGPKSVKGLEKGLGRMGAKEFEEAKIVMRVPEQVLADFRVLVESTKQIDGLYEEARDWYHNIRGLTDRETENDRESALLGLLIATYSPRAKFSLNLAEAVFMYKAVKKDIEEGKEDLLRQYLETFPGAEKRKPGSFRGFTGAHKVPNFALNLIAPNLAGERDEFGNIVLDDLYYWNSTIDTWMIDAFYPFLKKASTSAEWNKIKGKLMAGTPSYRYMANLVAEEAEKLNILPHELQAIIWVASQIRQTGESGLGVTTQFAFNQIRDAIKNVATIKQDLKVLQTLEENDWMATIIKTIDEQGFEEAARYVKEPKQGVRSIAARGKTGSAFKYVPTAVNEAEKELKPHQDPKFKDLNVWYVMNNVVQMPTGKFNNLYDSITLFLDPEFSTDKAVKHILGRFNPDAKRSSDYFVKEMAKAIMEELNL